MLPVIRAGYYLQDKAVPYNMKLLIISQMLQMLQMLHMLQML